MGTAFEAVLAQIEEELGENAEIEGRTQSG